VGNPDIVDYHEFADCWATSIFSGACELAAIFFGLIICGKSTKLINILITLATDLARDPDETLDMECLCQSLMPSIFSLTAILLSTA
jgi:hypothetical protein